MQLHFLRCLIWFYVISTVFIIFVHLINIYTSQQSHDLFSCSPSIEWESKCKKTVGKSGWLSWWTIPPCRTMSSRAISSKASSMLRYCFAEVSSAASAPVRSASVHASSNSTCRCASRSHLFPAGRKTHHEYLVLIAVKCLKMKSSLIHVPRNL